MLKPSAKIVLDTGGSLVVKVLREEEIGRKILVFLTGKVSLHGSEFIIGLSTFIKKITSPELPDVQGNPALSASQSLPCLNGSIVRSSY